MALSSPSAKPTPPPTFANKQTTNNPISYVCMCVCCGLVCRELGIAIVPYSPLGRGFFAGYKPEAGNQDFRSIQPRLTGENLEKNEVLRARVEAIAARKGCTLNQLALAWVLHNGNDVVPIPGTTKKVNLESNIGAVGISLSKEEIAEIEAAVPPSEVAGDRYHADHLKGTWRYAQTPPLSSWKNGSKAA
jgi:diketogulonate reductase-like aldo/keto reductase